MQYTAAVHDDASELNKTLNMTWRAGDQLGLMKWTAEHMAAGVSYADSDGNTVLQGVVWRDRDNGRIRLHDTRHVREM